MRDERGLNRDRDLDALLDQALSSYADQEPDGALRARITARLAEVSPRRQRMWLFGAVAACAAIVLLAFLLHPAAYAPISRPLAGPSVATVPAPPAINIKRQPAVHPLAVLTAQRTHRSERHTVVRSSSSFPKPSPLTAEERLLLQFAVEHPEQARQVLAPQDNAPLETKELSIAPIHVAALIDSKTQRSED